MRAMENRYVLPALLLPLVLASCATPVRGPVPGPAPGLPPRQGGGYYLDDGPGAHPPADLGAIPNPVPKPEPLIARANQPYEVMGQSFVPETRLKPFEQVGMASWYGRMFQGKKTASGESYDMYAMTAAHPTLPILSYARVTNLANGKSVIVKINDRGPFLHNRIIDLSYTAAYKLGMIGHGSARVRVQSIMPGEAPDEGGGQELAAGYYLQLGAFQSESSARSLLRKAAAALEIEPGQAHVVLTNNLHMVSLGPFIDRQQAEAWAAKCELVLNIQPHTIQR